MKTFSFALIALIAASASAVAQPCAYDPEHPELAALCEGIDAAAKEADPCGGPIPLGELLVKSAGTPAGNALVGKVLAAVAAETGRELSPEEIAALTTDPRAADRLLTVSVPQIAAGLKKLQAAADLQAPKPIEPPDYKLPSGVRLENAASYFDAVVEAPKEIAPGILRGDEPSGLAPAKIQAHRAMGEILNRLASNARVPSGERFRVTYNGSSFSTIDGFLAALAKSGHAITATVNQGVANFLDLKAAGPGGVSCEVKTAVMIDTGRKAADGSAITVPGVHSGLKFDISGPDVEARVSFFQGVGGTGFFAEGLGKDQSWVAARDIESFSGSDAIRAASAAGLWRDAVAEMVTKGNLIGGGYGQTGVCNDSVALLQLLITGRTTIFPLTMDHGLVLGYLDSKIAEGGSLASRYKALRGAVEKLPFDGVPATESDPTQPRRILDSMPR